MSEALTPIFDELDDKMKDAISHLKNELGKLRAGRATPSMLDSVQVEYYGSMVPLNQVANVNTPDARTLVIQPWEKSILQDIERAIINANLGYNPQNDGDIIIMNIPQLTEERRGLLVKNVKAEAEHAKVSIRNARRDANDAIKKEQKNGLSEDLAKSAEDDVQKVIDETSKSIDTIAEAKEKEMMTV